ncbi:diacylglycerol/lipid kinase family protein [Bacteroidota bacterium]
MHAGKIKTLFIINPILERKTGKSISQLIAEHLDSDRFSPTILYSEYEGHAKVLASQNAGKYQLIVAGGGDGTINQICHSLVHTDTMLGILPLGSGKGLARSLGIPLNIKDAIKTINRLNIARIDTGMLGTYRFFNIAGIGFDAEVAHAYAGSITRGFFPYALNIIKKLPGYSSISVGVTIENRNISGRYFIVSFANSSQWGYGAHISPMSKPDDGLLNICLIRNFPKIFAPGLMIRLYTKTIHRSKYMETIPVKKAVISGNGSFKGHIDGEPVEFNAPFNVSIEPGSLKVVYDAK